MATGGGARSRSSTAAEQASPTSETAAGVPEYDQHGHGHFFTKKTFHKPTYCHHCTDMLWGLIGQGCICEVCNFVVHDRCLRTVVSPCSTIATNVIKNPVPHCWTDGGPLKRKFCNVCRKRIEDTSAAVRCEVCEYVVHAECQDFSVPDCKECATYVPDQEARPELVVQYHHWREGRSTSIAFHSFVTDRIVSARQPTAQLEVPPLQEDVLVGRVSGRHAVRVVRLDSKYTRPHTQRVWTCLRSTTSLFVLFAFVSVYVRYVRRAAATRVFARSDRLAALLFSFNQAHPICVAKLPLECNFGKRRTHSQPCFCCRLIERVHVRSFCSLL